MQTKSRTDLLTDNPWIRDSPDYAAALHFIEAVGTPDDKGGVLVPWDATTFGHFGGEVYGNLQPGIRMFRRPADRPTYARSECYVPDCAENAPEFHALRCWETAEKRPAERGCTEVYFSAASLHHLRVAAGVAPARTAATTPGAEAAPAEPQPAVEQPSATAAPGAEAAPTGGYFSTADLATRHGVGAGALDQRLRRWRRKRAPGGEYVEQDLGARGEPKYLYRESAVWSIIEELRGVGNP